jgi:hypothetical protein
LCIVSVLYTLRFFIFLFFIFYFFSTNFYSSIHNILNFLENPNSSTNKYKFDISYKDIFYPLNIVFNFFIFFIDCFYLIDFFYPTTYELYKNNIF